MASAKEMAPQEDDDRSDDRAEEISTTDLDDHGHSAEERDSGHGHGNRNTAEASADRWHATTRSVGEMRRSEDDPANVHSIRIGFGKQRGGLFLLLSLSRFRFFSRFTTSFHASVEKRNEKCAEFCFAGTTAPASAEQIVHRDRKHEVGLSADQDHEDAISR